MSNIEERIAERIFDIGFIKKAGFKIGDCRYIARSFSDLLPPEEIIEKYEQGKLVELGENEKVCKVIHTKGTFEDYCDDYF